MDSAQKATPHWKNEYGTGEGCSKQIMTLQAPFHLPQTEIFPGEWWSGRVTGVAGWWGEHHVTPPWHDLAWLPSGTHVIIAQRRFQKGVKLASLGLHAICHVPCADFLPPDHPLGLHRFPFLGWFLIQDISGLPDLLTTTPVRIIHMLLWPQHSSHVNNHQMFTLSSHLSSDVDGNSITSWVVDKPNLPKIEL